MTCTIQMLAEVDSMNDGVGFSPWNQSTGKRLFDLLLAVVLLTLSSPVLPVVAIAILVSSKGPIFYRQWRAGRGGKEFQLFKFRTMAHAPQQVGPSVTRAGDPRITAVGRLLRRWKLDELPQLLNVIRGEMSLVGPRPDVPQYLASLNPAQRQILCLRPGLTGLATLHYANEEQLLSKIPRERLEYFYCNEVLPEKVRIDLEYAQTAGFLTDLTILFLTARTILR